MTKHDETLLNFIHVIKDKKLSPEEIVYIIRNIVDTDKLAEYLIHVSNYDY